MKSKDLSLSYRESYLKAKKFGIKLDDREVFFSSDYSMTELKQRADAKLVTFEEFLLAAINKAVYDFSLGNERKLEM